MHKNFKELKIKSVLFSFVINAAIFLTFANLLQLKSFYILILSILLLLSIPVHLYCSSKNECEKKRFNEYCLYLKHIVINYKISNKVYTALLDTLPAFEESSNMRVCIQRAIHSIEEANSLETALQEITKEYDNSYIRQIHMFMILGESDVGTNCYTALSQVNVKGWQYNVELLHQEKEKIRSRNLMFIVISLVLAFLMVFMCSFFPNINVREFLLSQTDYQRNTFVFLFLTILVYALIPFTLTSKWINEKE